MLGLRCVLTLFAIPETGLVRRKRHKDLISETYRIDLPRVFGLVEHEYPGDKVLLEFMNVDHAA